MATGYIRSLFREKAEEKEEPNRMLTAMRPAETVAEIRREEVRLNVEKGRQKALVERRAEKGRGRTRNGRDKREAWRPCARKVDR